MKEYLDKLPVFDFLRDDLHSIVFCETMNLIVKYDKSKGKFFAFWKTASLRKINRYLKKNYTLIMRHCTELSFDYVPYDNAHSLHEVIGYYDTSLKNDLLSESFMNIINDPNNSFTRREKEIIKYYLKGYSLSEIADMLGFSDTTIYDSFDKAVSKIGRVYRNPKK